MYIIDIRWHECSNFLNFFSNHDRIITSDFRRAQLPVVERAFVLITVSMYRAEQTTTSALEAGQSNFLAAGHASVLLLLAVLIAVLVVAVGYRGVIAGTVTGATLVVDILLVGGTLEQRALDRGLCGVGHGRDGSGHGRRDRGGHGGGVYCAAAVAVDAGGAADVGEALRCDDGADVGAGSGCRGGHRRDGRGTADRRRLLFS